MNDTELLAFILRVLSIVGEADSHGSIWWRTDGEYAPVRFMVLCNDTFHWACADCEDVTPENIDLLEQSFKDSEIHGGELFCARIRKMRPQGACYAYYDKEEWPLFDACGPEREIGFGNPMTPEQAWRKKHE